MVRVATGAHHNVTLSGEFFTSVPMEWCQGKWRDLTSVLPDNHRMRTVLDRIACAIPAIPNSMFAESASFTGKAFNVVHPYNHTVVIGSGVRLDATIDLSPHTINTVELNVYGNLVISKGESNTLSINADDNILNLIEKKVDGTKLTLSILPNVEFETNNPILYHLTIPSDVCSLTVTGTGSVAIENLETSDFNCSVSGSGCVQVLQGHVDHQQVELSGTGRYLAPNLEADHSELVVCGVGKADVQALNILEVKVSGYGECFYHGFPPRTSLHASGLGIVKHI